VVWVPQPQQPPPSTHSACTVDADSVPLINTTPRMHTGATHAPMGPGAAMDAKTMTMTAHHCYRQAAPHLHDHHHVSASHSDPQ
jgi:hypothetical protein